MSQSRTDYGVRGETGEREPKGAKSSDTKGEKHVSVPKADSTKGTPGQTGEREPAGSKASDATGERKVTITGGVGMGKADSIGDREGGHMGKHDGHTGEFNTGRHSGNVLTRKREYGKEKY